jgi:hypothetical protein
MVAGIAAAIIYRRSREFSEEVSREIDTAKAKQVTSGILLRDMYVST